MLPLLKTKLEVGAIAVALVIGGIALHEHDAKVKEQAVAQAVIDTQTQVQADNDKKIGDLQKQLDARDAASKAQLADMAKTVALLKTPQQQVNWSQDQLATALKGITIQLDSKGQAVATIPAATVPQLPQVIEQCKECEVKLAVATADATDRQAQANLAQLQIDSLRKENMALVVQAKGGSTWSRTARALKYIVIGAGVGAVAVCGSGHCK